MKPNSQKNDASSSSSTPKDGISRRSFLARTGAATGAAASASVWMSGISRATPSSGTRTGIVAFMRGGMDALSVVCPVNDLEYQGKRPTIKVAPPAIGNRAWLDGTFAMSPGGVDATGTLDWIEPYIDGHLCFAHGVGVFGQGRSHFTGMLNLEHGINPGQPFPSDGWIARHMFDVPDAVPPLQVKGIAHSNLLPTSMMAAPKTLPIGDVSNLSFPGPETPVLPPLIDTSALRQSVVTNMYANTPRVQAMLAAEDAFAALAELTSVAYPTPGSNGYPDTPFGRAMANTAAIIKDPTVHVDMIHIDLGSWDHHVDQDPNNPGGKLYEILNDLSTSLGAFYQDMGGSAGVDKYLYLGMTEFGRQIAENAGFGTDHGYGSLMTVMGSGVSPLDGGAGGSVVAPFGPIINAYDPINMDALDVYYDIRSVLIEAITNRLCWLGTSIFDVFPLFAPPMTPPVTIIG